MLVIKDKTFVDVAERNVVGIVPLYYNMKKASPVVVDSKKIFNGLQAAYSGGNIGVISNNISKIWNASDFKDHEEEDLKVIKWLVFETNIVIDFAKTGYKTTRPEYVDKIIKQKINGRVPYFFMYAKNKQEKNVEPINDSLVNKLCKQFKSFPIRYKLSTITETYPEDMMQNPDIVIDEEVIKKYKKLNNSFRNKINNEDKFKTNESYVKLKVQQELLDGAYSESEIVDMLVKRLFIESNSICKDLLWFAFGDVLKKNTDAHVDGKYHICRNCAGKFIKTHKNQRYCDKCKGKYYEPLEYQYIVCCDCHERFMAPAKATKTIRCPECQKKADKEIKRKWKRKHDAELKSRTSKSILKTAEKPQ